MNPLRTAVLLMAHGAPESLDEILPYLRNILKGKTPSDKVLHQIKERYALVGGKSPLLGITQQQASALETRLNQGGLSFQVYIGMRHWHPFIQETVKQIKSDQPDRIVAISLAPQYSGLSVGAYIRTLEQALLASDLEIPVRRVTSWHKQPHLIEAFVKKINEGLAQYEARNRSDVHLLFTAHSLPAHVLSERDPYPDEVGGTVESIIKGLALNSSVRRCHFAYQSRGFRPGKWLEPDVETIIGKLAKVGVRHLLVVPIGFVSDHVEILYDVDMLYKELAASQGISLRRTDSLNASPLFIEALNDLVLSNQPS